MDAVAYCAGFFDGEGCISISDSGPGRGRQLRLITSQKYDDRPLLLMKETFGGAVYLFSSGLPKHVTTGRVAVRMLEQMLPYLLVKYDQAVVAAKFFEMDLDERIAADLELRRLKRTFKLVGTAS